MTRAQAGRACSVWAVLALALALRLYRFPEVPPGLDFDEASNGLDALDLLAGHFRIFFPASGGREPLQMYLEALAMVPFGATTLAIRLPSVIAGTAAVGAVYLLAREWLGWLGRKRDGHWPALFAALLLALLLSHVVVSRMGFRANWLPFFSALALLLLLRALRLGRRRDFAAAGLVIGLGQYTYLAARFLPLAAALVVALFLAARLPRPAGFGRRLVVMGLVAALVASPLAAYFAAHPGDFFEHTDYVSALNTDRQTSLLENARGLAGMFLFHGDANWRHNYGERPLFDPVAGAFSLIGLGTLTAVFVRRRPTPAGARVAILAAAGWLVVFLLPSLFSEGAPNFLRTLGILPVAVLFPALGLDAVCAAVRRIGSRAPRSLGAAPAAFAFLVIGGLTAQAYFTDYPGRLETYLYFSGDYVDAARAVRNLARAPAVFLDTYFARHHSVMFEIRGLAFRSFDARRTWVMPAGEADYFLPLADPSLPEARIAALARLAGAERTDVLDSHGRPLLAFLHKPAAAGPAAPTPADRRFAPVVFGDTFELLGFTLDPPPGSVDPDMPLNVTLGWRVLKPGPADTTFSVRVVDQEGYVWTQRDEQPGGAAFPADTWAVGDTIFDRFTLRLPADLPPGRFALELVTYSLATRAPWPVAAAGGPTERAPLGEFTVTAPSPAAAAGVHPGHAVGSLLAPGVTLLGYDFEPKEARVGQPARLHLFWRAGDVGGRRLQLNVRLVDGRGGVVAAREMPLGGDYPTDRWRPGDVLHTVHTLDVSARAMGGPSRLALELGDADGPIGRIALDGPGLVGRERRWDAPPDLQQASAPVGALAELIGYRLQPAATDLQAGQPLLATLFWRARAETDADYTVFVQVLDGNGRLVAQDDHPPQGGAAPTHSWVAGEVIEDRHTVPLPRGLPAGAYRLITGLYDAGTGVRLPTAGGSGFVELTGLTLRGG